MAIGDEAAIEAVIRGIFDNFAAHRSDAIEGLLDDDCTIWDLFQPELIRGPAEREKFHESDQAQMQARGALTMTIETPLTDVWGDTALRDEFRGHSIELSSCCCGNANGRMTSGGRRTLSYAGFDRPRPSTAGPPQTWTKALRGTGPPEW